MKKAIIGIVGKHNKEYLNGKVDTVIRDAMKQAVFDNGAIAIGILSPLRELDTMRHEWVDILTELEKEMLQNQIDLCDGVILAGGDASEQFECYVADYCREKDIPLLGICAGFQNMVRAAGGGSADLGHKRHSSMEAYVHKAFLEPDSRIRAIMDQDAVMVNSRHIHCVVDPGTLKVAAWSHDRVIEAVEDPEKRFYIGLQFHPEYLYLGDEKMNRVFEEFISAVQDNME